MGVGELAQLGVALLILIVALLALSSFIQLSPRFSDGFVDRVGPIRAARPSRRTTEMGLDPAALRHTVLPISNFRWRQVVRELEALDRLFDHPFQEAPESFDRAWLVHRLDRLEQVAGPMPHLSPPPDLLYPKPTWLDRINTWLNRANSPGAREL